MPRWPIGEPLADGRCAAPSAERNKAAILDVLRRVLPPAGLVLEIGSGSGQHVVHFGRALPGLAWQPTDPNPAHRFSIARWIEAEDVSNVRPPLHLDVHERPWPVAQADAIVCINVLHVSPWSACRALFDGARALVRLGGAVFVYGPFRCDGRHTAPSNAAFDESLRAHDAAWGLRDTGEVAEQARDAGFRLDEIVEMPSNNLSLVFRREEPAS